MTRLWYNIPSNNNNNNNVMTEMTWGGVLVV